MAAGTEYNRGEHRFDVQCSNSTYNTIERKYVFAAATAACQIFSAANDGCAGYVLRAASLVSALQFCRSEKVAFREFGARSCHVYPRCLFLLQYLSNFSERNHFQMGVLASKIRKKLPQTVDIGEEVNKLAEDVEWGSR